MRKTKRRTPLESNLASTTDLTGTEVNFWQRSGSLADNVGHRGIQQLPAALMVEGLEAASTITKPLLFEEARKFFAAMRM